MALDNTTTFTINARDNSSRAFRSAQTSLGSLGMAAKSVAPLLGAIGGVAVVRGLTRYAAETLKAADETIKMSRAAGVSARTMQEMAHAANISGISTDALQKGLTRFNKTVGETKAGTGTLITLLRKMPDVMVDIEQSAGSVAGGMGEVGKSSVGVVSGMKDIEDAAGGAAGGMKTVSVSLHDALVQAKDSDQALDIMLQALTSMTDQSKIAALAGAAFGRQMGPKMANLIMDGERGIADLRAEAHKLGVVLDDELLMNAEAANDALDRLGKASTSVGRELVLTLAPSLTSVAEGVLDVIQGFRKWSREADELTPKIQEVDSYFSAFWGGIADAVGWDGLFGGFSSALDDSEAEIRELEEAIDDLKASIFEARRFSVAGLLDDKALSKDEMALRSLQGELERARVKRQAMLDEMGDGVTTIEITSSAIEDQGEVVAEVVDELDAYIDSLREEARVNSLSAREKRIHNAVREAEKRGIIDVNGKIAEMAGRLYDEAQARKRATASAKDQQKAMAGVRAEYERTLYADNMLANQEAASRHASIRKWKEYKESVLGDIDGVGEAHEEMNMALPGHTEAATSQMSKIWDNAVQSMQSSFSDTIYNLLWEDGISSFKDFGKALVDIFKKMVAEMVAAWATSKITDFLGGVFPSLSGGGGVASSVAGSAISSAAGGGGGGGIGSILSSMGSKIAGSVKSALGIGGSAAVGATGSALASGAGAWTIGSGGAAAGAAAGAAGGAAAGGIGALAGAAIPILGAGLLFESLFGTSNKKWKGEMKQFHNALQNGIQIDDAKGIKTVADGMQAVTLGSNNSTDALEALKGMLGYTTTSADYFVYATDQVTGDKYLRVQDNLQGLITKYDTLIEKSKAYTAAIAEGKSKAQATTIARAEVEAEAQVRGIGIAQKDKYERSRGKGDGPYVPSGQLEPKAGETYSDVLTELQRRAQKVKVGTGKESYYTTVGRQEDYAAREAAGRHDRWGGGKMYGGIASGPASGYSELLHGREAVIPLADGNRLRAPIQMPGLTKGGGMSDVLPVLQHIADQIDRIYDASRRGRNSDQGGGVGEVVRELRTLSERTELNNNRLIRAVSRQGLRRFQTGGVGERVTV